MLKRLCENKKYYIAILIITMLGGIFRLLCCFWGFPHQLHPDEPTVVNTTIDMLARHSWEAHTYNRPDQLEIKCLGMIYTIFSWLKYHVPACEAIGEHTGAFYVIGRMYTAFLGTLIIPFGAILTGKLLKYDAVKKQYAQIIASWLLAFCPIFVQHSAYVTPDIVLSFVVIIFTYLCTCYVENDGKTKKYIYYSAILLGGGIAIKYPAAIMSMMIAIAVIVCALRNKAYKDIVIVGGKCILIALATLFIIAPNLFTDIESVLTVISLEARDSHLGADGLDFWGNMKYYYKDISYYLGYLCEAGFWIGVLYLIKNRKIQYISLGVYALFFVCMSVLALHWQRWGIPMYIGYIIIVAIGMSSLLTWSEKMLGNKPLYNRLIRVLTISMIVISMSSVFVSGAIITKWSVAKDARVEAITFCTENEITKENSIYEGYTPLVTDYRYSQYNAFVMNGDTIKLKEQNENIRYYVLSSSFMGRFMGNRERYPDETRFYELLDDNFTLIFTLKGEGYPIAKREIDNIRNGIKFLTRQDLVTGNSQYIYELNN